MPRLLTSRERAPGTHWIGGWVGSRAGVKEKTHDPYRTRNPIIQPVAQSYTTELSRLTHTQSYPVGTKCSLPCVRLSGIEVDHSPSSSAEVRWRGAIPRLPNTPSWLDVQLKNRDNFTLMCVCARARAPFPQLQLLHPEDGGTKVLRNVGILSQHYTSQPEHLDLNLHRREI
jgi:hypothetical protein